MELPAKVKIGVSGCPMTCGESFVRDIGVQGKKNGWTFIFGGNSGGHPRIGDVLAEDLTTEQVLELARKSVRILSGKREKTGKDRPLYRKDWDRSNEKDAWSARVN